MRPIPEGVAAAEVLRVGDRSGHAAAGEPGLPDILLGGAVAAAFSLLSGGFKLLADAASWWFAAGGAVFRLATGFSLALVGAGYLIGIVAGLAMLLGVVIAWGVAVPALTATAGIPAGSSLAAFATGIWSQQVRFIGAGTIGVGAVWTLLVLMRPMAEGVRASLRAMRDIRGGRGQAIPRTERDIPIHWVAGFSLLLALPMALVFGAFLTDAEAPPLATRAASGQVLDRLAQAIPEMLVGWADLMPSNNTRAKGRKDITPGDHAGSYVRYGVREHAMAAAMNGLALHGGLIPYGGTFMTFSDYCRPAIRLAAMMSRTNEQAAALSRAAGQGSGQARHGDF